jgi:serine/threonine protein kinase
VQSQAEASLHGRYRLGAALGHGGMAAVYEARDELLGRDVAIKVFRSSGLTDDEVRRQRTEVKLLAGLSHHSVVTLLDAGVDLDDDGTPRIYLVMELVRGLDLKQRIAEGPVSLLEAAEIGCDLADGLEYMHGVGVVHRDITPANILLGEPGTGRQARAKLTDFGIAEVEGRVPGPTELMTGTAAYLSPEQARREPVAPASDVYSLGLVLLEALTGVVAFPGATRVESALRRLTEDPEVPEFLPEHWRALLRAMTARDQADRPTVPELLLAFRQAAKEESGRHRDAEPTADRTSEDTRLTAARQYEVLDSRTDETFDLLTALAARVLSAPVSMVSLLDEDRVWSAARPGVDVGELSREAGRRAAALLRTSPWIIEDMRTDPRAARNPLVAGDFGVQFYAGVPLRTSEGRIIGTLCVLDFTSRTISPDEIQTLEDLAAMVRNEVELRAAAIPLPVAAA